MPGLWDKGNPNWSRQVANLTAINLLSALSRDTANSTLEHFSERLLTAGGLSFVHNSSSTMGITHCATAHCVIVANNPPSRTATRITPGKQK
ncbi:MAG: hypothetical protein ABI670_08375 [Chloroflexota bacterium]